MLYKVKRALKLTADTYDEASLTEYFVGVEA